ncbi:hypothetical protein SARC_10233 [Sphaeroforma arctica JP610]|uniref:NAD-dependent epimerase/dehydratase domain-containing protein n=1 Tax=Sphaeroforma arctica JP610 TaxID=667725 RepID=A0A0L0FKL4_9EUKA|nr:hypothetical protein SARC_10233 [Sphaeroforma arctica JP610]KNC77305.1 hypothetical protein SARC_10233 [Sphaeroforma arctica JP610]|eukprot:XP_014151207.1 hypothetical protein SARC_10233 [Sphaeroforma arctica JP610]
MAHDRYLVLAILTVGILYLLLDRSAEKVTYNPSNSHFEHMNNPPPTEKVRMASTSNDENPDFLQPYYRSKDDVPPINYANENDEKKIILVTGAAGFIGMHLALQLHRRNHFVVGIDNFDAYYDIHLKRDRAYELHKQNIPMFLVDVCDGDKVHALFKKYKFTHVAHLAAQAGVRYSLINPLAYVRANVQCFTNLLEVIRNYPGVKVVFASSSSVYGRNTKVPFSVFDKINAPSSLYAATKKSNEDIARVYHHLYKIPLTGLRFFTVYGPWGRPDMAVYDFSVRMLRGEKINVYSHGVLQRDFTYIDDIVDGIIAAINKGSDFEVFNLGKGHPEYVNELITEIERVMGVPAVRNEMPIQPGDVALTYADIEHTYNRLGFRPSTSLRDGITAWGIWFKEYTAFIEAGDFKKPDAFMYVLEEGSNNGAEGFMDGEQAMHNGDDNEELAL